MSEEIKLETAHSGGVKLNAELIEAFSAAFLTNRFDEPKPTAGWMREAWELYGSDAAAVAIAAPRNHGKSTSLTHVFILATVLLRAEDYIGIVGSSEEMAQEHLQDIDNELHENEDLQMSSVTKVKKWVVDQKTDIVCEMADGHQFRIFARGSEQKIRGRKWKGKRPGLIVFEDAEDDEQVESKERREKFRRWMLRAARQALRDGGRTRMHGTILHDDAMLSRLMKNKSWMSRRYSAHKSFDDFSEILWPEKFSEERLRAIRQEFIEEGDSAGYSQEYLNDPLDNDQQFFRKDDFREMDDDDRFRPKKFVIGVDFAFTQVAHNDRCAFEVGGLDTNNTIHAVYSRAEHWDSNQSIDFLFDLEERWHPEFFIFEGGVATQAILPTIYREMANRNAWLGLVVMPAIGDKRLRATALQKRMRAGAVKFDKEMEDYADLEAEMRKFTGHRKGGRDDRVDAMAWMAHGCLKIDQLEPEDFEPEDERHLPPRYEGRSTVTGY